MADEIGFIQRVEKGRSHGVAELDENGFLNAQQLPQRLQCLEAETDEDILQGMPLTLKQNGHLGLACSDEGMRSCVVGLAISSATVGHACSYTSFGTVKADDWREIAPHSLLKIGQIYYLDVNLGGITNIPPENGYLVVLGRATGQNAIALNIGQSILL